MSTNYPRVAQLKTLAAFQARLSELNVSLPCDERVLSAEDKSPLGESIQLGPLRLAIVGRFIRWKAGMLIAMELLAN